MDNAAFPIELFQLIIDELSGLEGVRGECGRISPTLRDCSLVCKAFAPLCQPHIFQEIYLAIHNNTSMSRSRLIDVLESHPNLSSHIKRVTYWLNTGEDHLPLDQKCDQSLSIYEGGYSASLHELLPAIHSLVFTCHDHDTTYDDDFDQPTESPCCIEPIDCVQLFSVFFQDFAGSPTITSFEIDFLHIGLQDILVFPALQQLTFSGIHWTLSNTLIQRNTQFPLHLKNLDLSDQRSFPIRILEYCPDIEHLQVKESYQSYLSLEDVSAIIPEGLEKVAAYTKLQTAHVSNITALAGLCDGADIMDIAAFPVLDQLTVSCHHFFNGVNDTAALHKVTRHAPALRSLSLTNLNAFSTPYWSPNINFDQCFQDCGTTLEHISLTYNGMNEDNWCGPISGSIPKLCHALSHMTINNQLKSIHLRFHNLKYRVVDWTRWNLVDCPWERLDRMLSANSASDFPYLKEITVTVHTSVRENPDTQQISELRGVLQGVWAQMLPLLHADHFDASISYLQPLPWTPEFKLALIRRKAAL